MREFVNSQGVGAFPHIGENSDVIWDRFGVTMQRTYVYINDDGNFTQAAYGTLREDVEALIAQ